jgi:Xaa-Pro aminopeptidase
MIRRIQRLREEMAAKGLEAILISHPINRRYMTGFTGTAGVALLTEKEAMFITDFRYVAQVKEQCPDYTLVRQARLNSIRLEPVSGLIEKLRLVKEPEELLLIKEAAKIADRAFEQILQQIRPGMTEKEVALRLEVIMREHGATSSSFDTIVASGWRSALPHGVASDKVIEKGDLVTLDFGAYYQGYASDITRTVMMGKPTEKQKEIYQIVLEANKKAIAGVQPGKTGKEVDAIARNYIKEHGYGDYFGHSTGHGLGMEVHEEPLVSTRGEEALVPGMVITIEPGIYIPDLGGVRIEDDLIVTESGYENITNVSKEIIMIH